MKTTPAAILQNPIDSKLTFSISTLSGTQCQSGLQRVPYCSIIWMQQGSAELSIGYISCRVTGGNMIFLMPFQPFSFTDCEDAAMTVIQFHPEFFCMFKHAGEISFYNVLFNNVYQKPVIHIEGKNIPLFTGIISGMLAELSNGEPGKHDLIVALLKTFFIYASRIKMARDNRGISELAPSDEPVILQNLQEAIEAHFREKHSPADFALLLHVTPKNLSRITKQYYNKTLSEIIADRIIAEAKRDLYMTGKTVKNIAYDLGFRDEFYFSKYFKKNVGISPQAYRKAMGTSKTL